MFPCLILYASLILQFDNSLVVIIICYWSLFHLTFTETTRVILSVVFLFLQLLLSGDIETNPGPHFYKDCPVCGKAMHVRSKYCLSCGFNLSKKIKGISRTWRSSVESSPSGSNNITNIPVTVSATNPANLIFPSQVPPVSLDGISCSAPVAADGKVLHDSLSESASSLPTDSKTALKWAKRKEKTNAKRRDLYYQNPEAKRKSSLKNYYINPSPIRKRALDAYYSNPSVKKRTLEAYHSNPSPFKRRAYDSYHSNPSPVKRRVLDAYYKHHELNKCKQRQMYRDKRDKLLDKRHIAALVSCSISKKYSKLRSGPSWFN